MKIGDLDNEKDVHSLQDPIERFQYLFPFYRMNINVFHAKLNLVSGIVAHSKDTEIISLDSMKAVFCVTPAWTAGWRNVERLLRTPEFKAITIKEKNAIKNKVQHEELINHVSKLEIGILAILWCQGTPKDKAAFLYKLANWKDNDDIAWSDDEIKFIFVKLLEYSTDVPFRYKDVFILNDSLSSNLGSLEDEIPDYE